MTQPMTPREKVAPCYECGSTERIGTASAPCNPELTALASGSGDPDLQKMQIGGGDHAELARLAEAVGVGEWHVNDMKPEGEVLVCGGEGMSYGLYATVANTMPEVAAFISAANPATVLALIAENAALTDALERAGQYQVEFRNRATEAERKLAEARGLMEQFHVHARSGQHFAYPLGALQSLDAFLSSTEAERG